MADRPMSLHEAELERGLVDLGRHLAFPPTPDLAARISQQLAARSARPPSLWRSFIPVQRRLAVAMVAVLALIGTVLTISPEARIAVAERLGLRGVLIREVPPLATPVPTVSGTPSSAGSPVAGSAAAAPGARLSLGQRMTLDEARARVAFEIPLPGTLGPPDEVYVGSVPAGGQVALVYHPRPDLPEAKTTGVGLLLTVFEGNVSNGALGKGIPPGTRLEEVMVNARRAFWIEGDPHTFFYLDSRNQMRTETTRLAGNVLLWERGPLTLRLESALSKDAVVAIANSVR